MEASLPTTGPDSSMSNAFPWGRSSTTSTRTTSAYPSPWILWAVVAPTFPAPTTVTFLRMRISFGVSGRPSAALSSAGATASPLTYSSHRESRFGSSTVLMMYSPSSWLVQPVSRPVMAIFRSYCPQMSRALWSLSPCCSKPMWVSSMAPARIIELGSAYWALPSRTMRGALPWMASNIP